MPQTTPRPKTFLRKVERKFMGALMWIAAFVLERVVMRSVKKAGKTSPKAEPGPTTLTSKGGEVDMPDL